jgi:hypothetical protein
MQVNFVNENDHFDEIDNTNNEGYHMRNSTTGINVLMDKIDPCVLAIWMNSTHQ